MVVNKRSFFNDLTVLALSVVAVTKNCPLSFFPTAEAAAASPTNSGVEHQEEEPEGDFALFKGGKTTEPKTAAFDEHDEGRYSFSPENEIDDAKMIYVSCPILMR